MALRIGTRGILFLEIKVHRSVIQTTAQVGVKGESVREITQLASCYVPAKLSLTRHTFRGPNPPSPRVNLSSRARKIQFLSEVTPRA